MQKEQQSIESQLQMARPRRHEIKRIPLTSEEKEFLGKIMDKAVAAEKAGDLKEALDLYTDYKNELLKIKEIKEIRERVKESEKSLELEKQYKDQVEILKKNGLIEKLPSGELGFIDINGQARPIPTYKDILKRVEAKKELLEKKKEQGFTQLLLVPFGMKLINIAGKAKELILKKYKQGNLKGINGDLLKLKEKKGMKEPISIAVKYADADISGDLVYYPEKFEQNDHGGKTKKEILEETDGWDVMFIEDLPDLPAQGKGKTIGGRKQLEASKSPEQYLEKMQTDPQYIGESGMTPEAELVYFMHYLQKNNQVIDDWQGGGKISWNLGGCFKNNRVCCSDWTRQAEQMRLEWYRPYHLGKDRGVRVGIKI